MPTKELARGVLELHDCEARIHKAEEDLALLLEQRRAIINRYNLNKGKTCD